MEGNILFPYPGPYDNINEAVRLSTVRKIREYIQGGYMRYIVLDLEWNQSPRGREDSVPHLPFEIIEIGAVMLDEQRRTVGEFHRLIRPQVYRQLHFPDY